MNNTDPDGRATRRSLRINEVSSGRIKLTPAFNNHVWPLHSFERHNTPAAGQKSYFNAYLSGAGRKSKLKWFIKDCLDTFKSYREQSWNGYYVGVCQGLTIVGSDEKGDIYGSEPAIGWDRKAKAPAFFGLVVVNPVTRRLVTAFPVGYSGYETDKVRVPAYAGVLSHSGIHVTADCGCT